MSEWTVTFDAKREPMFMDEGGGGWVPMARFCEVEDDLVEARKARDWLAERFLDPEDDPADCSLLSLVQMCFEWGEKAWGAAGRELERASKAEAALVEARKALGEAIQVIEWCGQNDKTPPYEYGDGPRARRKDGTIPYPGKAFNTPAEFARYWPDRLRAALVSVGGEAAEE